MWSISRTWCNGSMCHEWTERVQQLGFLEHAKQPKTESQPAWSRGVASIPNLHWHLDQGQVPGTFVCARANSGKKGTHEWVPSNTVHLWQRPMCQLNMSSLQSTWCTIRWKCPLSSFVRPKTSWILILFCGTIFHDGPCMYLCKMNAWLTHAFITMKNTQIEGLNRAQIRTRGLIKPGALSKIWLNK